MICQPCSRLCPKCGLGWLPVRLSYRPLHVNLHTNYPLKVTKASFLYYDFTETDDIMITGYQGTDSSILIPEEINGKKVKVIKREHLRIATD
ncbi:MAG: hypothetical protein II919_06300 [Lachnospiraceae bacterium]|nr:hypothetical protein [Lachnospiraceae bacterium]